ncbi:hypothetical protein B0H17DRAFT_896690, partial [Mycena rosella]
PTGLIWDSTNYSCAYDALFTSMADIWKDDPVLWTQCLIRTSGLLGLWALSMTEQHDPPERSRDAVRRLLHFQDPNSFPLGPKKIRLDPLFMHMTDRRSYSSVISSCEQC